MGESGDAYREVKLDQQDNIIRRANPRTFRVANRTLFRSEFVVTGERKVVKRRSQPREDYSAFKATMAGFAEDIKLAMLSQHQQTRQEVRQSRHDILAAIKSSPVEYIKLMSEFGMLLLLFALLVRFALKIELVNTGFALFMLFSLGFYWLMAWRKQASEKRGNDKA